MAISRYFDDIRIGPFLGTSQKLDAIRSAVKRGSIQFTIILLSEGERLDQLAHRYYGDARYWWIIAAASNIGWWLQVPSGTRLIVPTSLDEIQAL